MSDEDEYFRKLDLEAKSRLKTALDAQKAASEADSQRMLHAMKCGKCGSDMKTEVFRGIEIERCISCGAVLLDPGELEMLAGHDQTDVFSSFFSIFGSGRTKG